MLLFFENSLKIDFVDQWGFSIEILIKTTFQTHEKPLSNISNLESVQENMKWKHEDNALTLWLCSGGSSSQLRQCPNWISGYGPGSLWELGWKSWGKKCGSFTRLGGAANIPQKPRGSEDFPMDSSGSASDNQQIDSETKHLRVQNWPKCNNLIASAVFEFLLEAKLCFLTVFLFCMPASFPYAKRHQLHSLFKTKTSSKTKSCSLLHWRWHSTRESELKTTFPNIGALQITPLKVGKQRLVLWLQKKVEHHDYVLRDVICSFGILW